MRLKLMMTIIVLEWNRSYKLITNYIKLQTKLKSAERTIGSTGSRWALVEYITLDRDTLRWPTE